MVIFHTNLDLDDLLDDNSYVPSFAKKQPSKPAVSKPKSTFNASQRSISNDPAPSLSNPKPTIGGGLMGLHKQTARNQPITFEDLMSNQKQEKPKTLEKNTSMKNLELKNNKDDDVDSIFSNSRTGMRRPLSRAGPQLSPQKQQSESLSVPKRMMPPLSKKNVTNKRQNTQNQSQDNDFFPKPPPKLASASKKQSTLDPLEGLSKEQNDQMKKFYEKQIEFQKESLQKLLEQQRLSRKNQIQKLKASHNEEIKKKLQLKDYEIQKMKEFYEMQLNMKNTQQKQNQDLSQINSKIEQNLSQLHKIQGRISEQYTSFQDKKRSQQNWDLKRREANLNKKQQQLKQLKKKLQDMEKDLKNDKQRFYSEKQRERNYLDEMMMKVTEKQNQLEGRFRRKQKDLTDEYDRKRVELDREKERVRMENLQSQEKKNSILSQQRELKNNMQSFEEKRKTLMNQLHQQKAQVMEKQIALSSKINQYEMKESQLDMERQELVNKMKILELEKKKLEVEAKGKYEKNILSNTLGTTKYEQTPKVHSFNKTGSNFDQYHRTISEMRDQMMRSMPKF